jgi:hypothetical protein
MFNIDCTYSDFIVSMNSGKKAQVRGNTITVGHDVGIPIGLGMTAGSCITLNPIFNVAGIHVFKHSTQMRWMDKLNKWHNITSLFENYGNEDIPELEQHHAMHGLVRGSIVPVPYPADPDYVVLYEVQHHRLYIHCFVHTWNRDVMRRMRRTVEQLQADHPIDTYIYSMRPNEEYALCSDTTFKFAKMVGYDFYETAVLGDGYEHDIYKRKKTNVIRFPQADVELDS